MEDEFDITFVGSHISKEAEIHFYVAGALFSLLYIFSELVI